MSEEISFQHLISLLQKELSSLEISSLPEEFYEEIRYYLIALKQLEKETESREGKDLLRRKYELIERVVSNLIKLRISKLVLHTVLRGEPKISLPWEESSFVRKIRLEMDDFVKEIVLPAAENEYAVIRVTQKVPHFLGIDGKEYGPYEPEDICTVPHQNARILIIKGAAQLITIFSRS